MIGKVTGVSNLAFKAHFVDDKEGNFKYLFDKSRGYLDKKELDFFTREIPDHDIRVSSIYINKDYHIDGVNLFNHASGEFKYINTEELPNVVVLNNIIKKLNSLYKESQRFHKNADYEKLYGQQKGFFQANSYYVEMYKKSLKHQ